MLGFAIIFGFYLLGMLLQELLQLPIPSNLVGLILFTLALYGKLIKLEWVERSAQWLTKHMMLFFVPFIVGSMAFYPILEQYGLAIVVSMVLSTCVVLLVTGWVTSWLVGKGEKERSGEQDV